MTQLGHYEILEEIGRGGFATVYKARDTRLKRTIALKILHSGWSGDPDFVRRFQQEAETIASLRHPNIVVIHDVGEADRQLYIAMEYLTGDDLQAWLTRQESALTLDDILPILRPIAEALDYAHSRGIIHRDIKPSNMMRDETGSSLRMVLMDFGLVKAMENSVALTMTSQMLGSPEYMAPEQADPNRMDEIGSQSDLYAFGIVAYQMLTGRVPFPGHSISTLNAHANLPVPAPQQYNPDLSDVVVAILSRMLAKVPAERYPSALAFINALQATLNTQRQAEIVAETAVTPNTSFVTTPTKAALQPEKKGVPMYVWLIGGFVGFVILAFLVWQFAGLGGGAEEPLDTEAVVAATLTALSAAASDSNQENDANSEAAIATVLPTEAVEQNSTEAAPSETEQVSESSSPSANASLGSRWERKTDGMEMVYVPADIFLMGSSSGADAAAKPNEQPQHEVTLDGYWIDHTEITNSLFARFVAETNYVTTAEEEGTSRIFFGSTWIDLSGVNWQHPAGPDSNLLRLDDYPVVLVSWFDAAAYCEWAGGQLPTEAQWEYAARGNDGQLYPWGNQFNGTLVNYCDVNCTADWKDASVNDGYAEISPVGNYPAGASWVDVLDMSGNVWEWVADWYDENYYTNTAVTNPTGPESGESKVLRGASWLNPELDLRAAYRDPQDPSFRSPYSGFRCVMAGQ